MKAEPPHSLACWLPKADRSSAHEAALRKG